MFRCLVALIIGLFLVLPAAGEVLLEEDFSSAAELRGDLAHTKILSGSLDFRYYEETGDRVRIEVSADGIRFDISELNLSGLDFHQKTLYISILLRSFNPSPKDSYAGLFLYRDDQEMFGMGNDYFSENFTFWTSAGDRPIGEVPTRVDGNIHLIVLRIDFNLSGPEKLKLWLDPLCTRDEDRQPDHIATEFEHEVGFNEIRLRTGHEGNVWEFDELRLGTDWRSVTPANRQIGSYFKHLTADKEPPGRAELIGGEMARFWPKGLAPQEDRHSFAVKQRMPAIAPLPDRWRLKPVFGRHNNHKYVYLDLAPEIDFYGTGEVTGALMRNGYQIVLYNKDNYGYGKPDQLYQSHPWVLGVRPDGSAFGVIFDTTWKAELDLRAGILFTTPVDAEDFPVIILEGSSPQAVMKKCADLTGKMPLPPRWALGYQQCRYSYNPDARVREIIDTFRSKRIPCDVLWFDIDYMDGYRVFTWDPEQFPDPRATNAYLHSRGFKSVWMIDPGVKVDPDYFVYRSGSEKDLWVQNASGEPFVGPVWPGDCVFPDFTMPRTREWWAGLYEAFLARGIDGVWNDMNEPAVFNEQTNWTMPPDCRHRGGDEIPAGPHIKYHNVYGMLMVRATREGILQARPDRRPFVLSRANYLGGQRYAATWTGDNKATWNHLRWSVPMSLNLSLSGQPFNGPDIGGFAGDATPDLWAHWIAAGAFFPFCRAHSAKGTADQEPWSFGPETEAAARIALSRRYRLMPYLYTQFRRSHQTGMPIMQPVFFADASDLDLRGEDEAFLLGPDILVVPQWAETPALPEGIWQSISLIKKNETADGYQCDLKVRGGAIIPVGHTVQTTAVLDTLNPLTLVVVLDENGQSRGELYEDAGEGFQYRNEHYCRSTFAAEEKGDHILVKCLDIEGRIQYDKRFVSVAVVGPEGIRCGFGDICNVVTVFHNPQHTRIPE